jgi:hypothetical protein
VPLHPQPDNDNEEACDKGIAARSSIDSMPMPFMSYFILCSLPPPTPAQNTWTQLRHDSILHCCIPYHIHNNHKEPPLSPEYTMVQFSPLVITIIWFCIANAVYLNYIKTGGMATDFFINTATAIQVLLRIAAFFCRWAFMFPWIWWWSCLVSNTFIWFWYLLIFNMTSILK